MDSVATSFSNSTGRSKYSKSIFIGLICRLPLRSTAYFGTFAPVALTTLNRALMAKMVRFSFRAIKSLSIFDSSNVKSCASSAASMVDR
jgi:hypothetical protein